MSRYTIIVEKRVTNYSAYCPDLPGCIAAGSTVAETMDNMKEAITFHLQGLREENIAIPEPSVEAMSIDVVV